MSGGPHPLALFAPDELARLAERARLDVHGAVKREALDAGAGRRAEEAAVSRDHARLVRGLTGLALAARCYALSRDPRGLTPIVWAAWAVHARSGLDTAIDETDRLADAVRSVAPRVFEVPGLAERLARSDVAAVRLALALGLPDGAASEPILRALAEDADASVRGAASQRIRASDRWGGAFPIPPDGHDDAVLERAKAVLDQDVFARNRDPDAAVRAFAPLSDALAVACWERVISLEHVRERALDAWLAPLIARPGGGAALARLVAIWASRGEAPIASKRLEQTRKRVPAAKRARALTELLAAMRAEEAAERGGEIRPLCYVRDDLAEHALALAPARGDWRPLLETILGGPIDLTPAEQEEYDVPSLTLSKLLARWPLDAELEDLLVRARRAGRPGRWHRIGADVWARLGPDPVLREKAWADLDSPDRDARDAAVAALLGPHHDRAKDGTVLALARRLYARPELRVAALRNADGLLPRARRDLERGRLTVEAAIVVLRQTPAEEQTDAMWSAARAVRDRVLAEGEGARLFVYCEALIRTGEAWDPSDLAFVRAAVDHAMTDEKGGAVLRFLIPAIERIDAPETAALLAEIDARATTDALREHVRAGRQWSDLAREAAR